MHYISKNKYHKLSHEGFCAMDGSDVCALMRRSRVTIRQMAQINGLTMKRVRELRRDGVARGMASWELYWMVEETRLMVSLNKSVIQHVRTEQRAA